LSRSKTVWISQHTASELLSALNERASAAHLTNVFNPSVLTIGDEVFASIRAEAEPGVRPFRAYLASLTSSAGPTLDLTRLAEGFGVGPVADPKLLLLDSEIYVTFNTGYQAHRDNDIYLQRLWPEYGPPQRCILQGGRQTVEKNWAFFHLGDELRAVYSLDPLVFLRGIRGKLGSPSDLWFERVASADAALPKRSMAIGTQLLVEDGGATALTIAHEKVHVLKKRAYFGRVVRIPLDGNDSPVEISRIRLLHSKRDMMPAPGRHNPNLISATYFAGLTRSTAGLMLSYGINDVSAGIATLEASELW
jgi:hypothetical protein